MENTSFSRSVSTFSMTCRVRTNIHANAEKVWDLLTNARDFPRWNSTVTEIKGEIRDGAKLIVRVPGTNRAFVPKVSGVIPKQQMIWTGGFAPMFLGVRTFTLQIRNDGSTDFTMEERFSGLMLPLIKKSLPDFGPIFKSYAEDLQREAERK